ncbi:MAG: hypothetical protein R3Y53_07720 [Bacillota bacterium]
MKIAMCPKVTDFNLHFAETQVIFGAVLSGAAFCFTAKFKFTLSFFVSYGTMKSRFDEKSCSTYWLFHFYGLQGGGIYEESYNLHYHSFTHYNTTTSRSVLTLKKQLR